MNEKLVQDLSLIPPHLNKQTTAESNINPPIKDGVMQLEHFGENVDSGAGPDVCT